jgi:hypothetical protein
LVSWITNKIAFVFWRNKFSKSAIAGNAKPVSIEEITETTLTQMQQKNHCNLRKMVLG